MSVECLDGDNCIMRHVSSREIQSAEQLKLLTITVENSIIK